MKNSTKAAVAAAGAVALLASGAGSLAFWNATATVDGARIHSGELKLVEGTGADACTAQSFKFADGTTYVGDNPGITRVVPGDTLTKTCQFKVVAVGQNLSAALATSGPTQSANSAFPLTATGSFTVGGANVSTITSADNGKTLEAKIVVDFPFGSTADNASQKTNKLVNAYTVTATQTAPAS